MPALVAFLFQINSQVRLRPNGFAIKQTKRIFTQSGVQQIQHGDHRDNKFVFGGRLIFFRAFLKKGLVFHFAAQVPNAKRNGHNDEWHGRKELLFGIIQFRGRRRSGDTIRVDQMFTNSTYGALRFEQKFDFGRPPQWESIEQSHDLQIIQQDFLNGRRQSLLAGIVDGIAHQKSQNPNRNDKTQRHESIIASLVFGASSASIGALSSVPSGARVAKTGRVAKS